MADFFLIDWNKFFVLFILFVISGLMYSGVRLLMGFREQLFFFVALVVIPIYFLTAIIYSLVYITIKKREGKSLE